MPKILKNVMNCVPNMYIAETQLEKSLCKAVLHKKIKEAENFIHQLSITDNFNSDLRIDVYDGEGIATYTDSLPLIAVKNNDAEMLKMLLSNGFEPHTPALGSYYTPLYYAAFKGFTASVKVLLEYPIEINKIFYNATPLAVALRFDHFEIAKLLLEKSNIVQLNIRDVETIVELPHDKFLYIFSEIAHDKKIPIFTLCSKYLTENYRPLDYEENNKYMLNYLNDNYDDSMNVLGSSDLE